MTTMTPHWFPTWQAAYHEAFVRSVITGRRYDVHYEAGVGWRVTETGRRWTDIREEAIL